MVSGRNAQALEEPAGEHGVEARVASVDDAESLGRALAGTVGVIDCASPFATTTGPVIEAPLRAKIPYPDVAAELEADLDTFARYRDRAREAGAVIVPAMAFFGGLGGLPATAATGDWTAAGTSTPSRPRSPSRRRVSLSPVGPLRSRCSDALCGAAPSAGRGRPVTVAPDGSRAAR